MSKSASPFRYFNSSPEIIRLAVMMYVKFPLSLRNVEDLLHERGVDISYETVRHWWNRFGPMFAAEIRRKRVDRMRAFTHWRWHLDEVYVKINGEMHYLWRAVDQEGDPASVDSVRHRGLLPLRAEDRRERLSSAMSSHPSWRHLQHRLDEAIQAVSGLSYGRREGQVHLTASKRGLTLDFNHYLVEGSEFDGHVANALIPGGRAHLLKHGRPVIFGFRIPADQILPACNPYGWREDEAPNLVREVLRTWADRIADPARSPPPRGFDIGVRFDKPVPAEWLSQVLYPDEAELLATYRE